MRPCEFAGSLDWPSRKTRSRRKGQGTHNARDWRKMASLTSLKGTGLVGAALIAIACSGDDFADCDEKRTCPSTAQGGMGGGAGATQDDGGDAGQRAQGGDAGQGSEGGAGGAGPECSSNDDCDDAEPKNGIETCDAGVCVAGNPPPSVVA